MCILLAGLCISSNARYVRSGVLHRAPALDRYLGFPIKPASRLLSCSALGCGN